MAVLVAGLQVLEGVARRVYHVNQEIWVCVCVCGGGETDGRTEQCVCAEWEFSDNE